MTVIIIVSILALLLTYFETNGILKNGMLIGFSFVAIILAIRFNYGNDYPVYYATYLDMCRYSFNIKAIMAGDFFRDPGWALLCFMFKPAGGFFSLIAAISVFEVFVVYYIIRKYVLKENYVFSVFVFLFTTNIFISSCSMIRQMLVATVFLALWPIIEKKRHAIFVCLIIYIMSFIHGSALILLPFAFWYFLPLQKGRIIAPSLLFVFFLFWIDKDSVNRIFQTFMVIDSFQDYADSYMRLSQGTWKLSPLMIAKTIPFFLYLYFIWDREDDPLIYLICISVIPFMIQPFGEIIPDVARISSYFYPFTIITVPYIYSSINRPVLRYGFISLFVAITLYNYFIFFQDPTFTEYYSEYHTIFEV